MSVDRARERTMPVDEFKIRCLALVDEVDETGAEIVITKRGRAVSRLVPTDKSVPQMWGRYRDHIRVLGDILAPVMPTEDWEAISNPDRVLDPEQPSER